MKTQSHKQALALSYFTLGYTLLECVAGLTLGILAGSTALIAFGLGSIAESLSGGVMVWRFRQHSDNDHEEEHLEQKAVKLVAYTFFILGTYVFLDSLKALYLHEVAQPSLWGIVLTALALIIMPILSWKKYRVGKSIGSRSLMADSKETLACVMLSIATLIGLGLNHFGYWWADPLAATVIGMLLIREGYHTYHEEKLCDC